MSLYDRLAKKPKLFIRCTGLTVSEFNLVAGRLAKKYPKAEQKRLSKRSRVRGIGAGRRWKLDLKNRFLLVLFYYRTYATQDLLAMVFQVGQASVSRSMGALEPSIRQCVPLPSKIYSDIKATKTLDDLEEIIPGLTALIDASEQQIQRPGRKDMERSHYSGKAHRYTSKVQYTSATDGLILHKTRHSPGRIHDFAVFKKKHPAFPDNLTRKDGSRDKKRTKVRELLDSGYQGINKEFPDRDAVVPYKKQKGVELSPEQKEFNKKHSKVRVYVEHAIRRVKRFRIMGSVCRNRLKKYDTVNDIVCGFANLRVLLVREAAG